MGGQVGYEFLGGEILNKGLVGNLLFNVVDGKCCDKIGICR